MTALTRITPTDVVRQVMGANLSSADIGYLLWNCTSFPFGPNLDKYRRDLLKMKLTTSVPGRLACEHCGSPAVRMGNSFLCDTCGPVVNPSAFGEA